MRRWEPSSQAIVGNGERCRSRISLGGPGPTETVRGIIDYMQSSGPTDAESAGSGRAPGQDGSIVVGRFRFTVR